MRQKLKATPSGAEAIDVDSRIESVAAPGAFRPAAGSFSLLADQPEGPEGIAQGLVVVQRQVALVILREPIGVFGELLQKIGLNLGQPRFGVAELVGRQPGPHGAAQKFVAVGTAHGAHPVGCFAIAPGHGLDVGLHPEFHQLGQHVETFHRVGPVVRHPLQHRPARHLLFRQFRHDRTSGRRPLMGDGLFWGAARPDASGGIGPGRHQRMSWTEFGRFDWTKLMGRTVRWPRAIAIGVRQGRIGVGCPVDWAESEVDGQSGGHH